MAETNRYHIRPSNESVFALEIFKTGLMIGKKHVLFFEQYEGEVRYNRENPEESSLRLVVEVRSGACRDEWLKPADRKQVVAVALNDLLAADRYPQLTFSSARILPQGARRFEINGALTIRDTSKPATLDVAMTLLGDDRLELDGNSQISFSDYNLKRPSSALGLSRTKDKMLLRFLLWAEKGS